MCLGELAEVVGVDTGTAAQVRVGGRAGTVSLLTLPDPGVPVAPGDWLLVHAGFALARLTAEDAAQAREIRERSTT
ncbi:HypC/HybG/HupF family hydrogenase formation chaperone [Nocardioides sp.]|uniref:HypC/HybG/HupF family hydrogenase formation chaperone n=1 Tax=Nocardioides sp. TaxID=35761 RepID=UPI002EDAE916